MLVLSLLFSLIFVHSDKLLDSFFRRKNRWEMVNKWYAYISKHILACVTPQDSSLSSIFWEGVEDVGVMNWLLRLGNRQTRGWGTNTFVSNDLKSKEDNFMNFFNNIFPHEKYPRFVSKQKQSLLVLILIQ